MSTEAAARPTQISIGAVAGFSVILLAVMFPINGARLWLNLTEFSRWGYTDLLFAGVALATALWMLQAKVRTRVPLYLIAAIALAVIGGEFYYVLYAFNAPESDNFLSSAIQFLGYRVVFMCAAVGLVSSLVSRPPRPGAQ